MRFPFITHTLLGGIALLSVAACSPGKPTEMKNLSAVSFEQVNLADSFWLEALPEVEIN